MGLGGAGRQAEQVLHSLGLLLYVAGASWSDVVRCATYLVNVRRDLPAVQEARLKVVRAP